MHIYQERSEGTMKTQKDVLKKFSKFKIPASKIPEYSNAEIFAQNIKTCSILKNTNVSYSDSASSFKNNQ